MATAKEAKGIMSKKKDLKPIEYVPDNPARKFMTKEEAIADKAKLRGRKEAGKKAMKDFDKPKEDATAVTSPEKEDKEAEKKAKAKVKREEAKKKTD